MLHTVRRIGIAACATIVAAACQQPSAEVQEIRCGSDPAVEAKIANALLSHVAAHLEGDPVSAAAIYTDDVWFQLDDGAELRSRETMVGVYEATYTTQRYVDIVYTDVETTVCGDAAHAVGHYSETSEVGDERITSRAQYMVLWRLQSDGSWKVSRGAVIAIPEGA